MRVGINATCLSDRPSGAKQRFIGIYGALFRLLPDVEFILYEPNDCRISDWFPRRPNLQARQTPIPSVGRIAKYLAGFCYWPNAFNRDRLDLFEAMHLPLIRPKRVTTLLTVHDLRCIYPGNGFLQRLLFSNVLRKALRRADHVVTVSRAMRDEILRFYPRTPVSVVYNGIESSIFDTISAADCAQVAKLYSLPSDFLLAIGHFERRKNYPELIRAISILKAKAQVLQLVIVGNDSGGMAQLQEQVDELGLTDQVHLLKGLSDHELRCIYLLCRLFVFSSLYEGFGIPILEAMAAGKPMVLSDLPVFREISQDQAIYFHSHDPHAMAAAIRNALASPAACDAMVEFGRRRVHEFSFDKLAQELAATYKQCQLSTRPSSSVGTPLKVLEGRLPPQPGPSPDRSL